MLAFLAGFVAVLAIVGTANAFLPGFWVTVYYVTAAGILSWQMPELARRRPTPAFLASLATGVLTLWTFSATASATESRVKPSDPFLLALGAAWVVSVAAFLFSAATGKPADRRLAAWMIPSMACGWLIAYISSNAGGAPSMIAFVERLLGLGKEAAETTVLVARKCVHFTFYGCVALLAAKMLRTAEPRTRRAIVFGILYALLLASFDELRQSGMSDRTGSFWDVLLDLSGALAFSTVFRKPASRKPARA